MYTLNEYFKNNLYLSYNLVAPSHRFDYSSSRWNDDKNFLPVAPPVRALSSIGCDAGILIGYREVLQILIWEKYEFYSRTCDASHTDCKVTFNFEFRPRREFFGERTIKNPLKINTEKSLADVK